MSRTRKTKSGRPTGMYAWLFNPKPPCMTCILLLCHMRIIVNVYMYSMKHYSTDLKALHVHILSMHSDI